MASKRKWSSMNAENRKAIRAEMLKIAVESFKQSYPLMTRGAVQVKASKFVDAAILRQAREQVVR